MSLSGNRIVGTLLYRYIDMRLLKCRYLALVHNKSILTLACNLTFIVTKEPYPLTHHINLTQLDYFPAACTCSTWIQSSYSYLHLIYANTLSAFHYSLVAVCCHMGQRLTQLRLGQQYIAFNLGPHNLLKWCDCSWNNRTCSFTKYQPPTILEHLWFYGSWYWISLM